MSPIEDIEDALDISFAQTEYLRVDDCRRVTGPGLLWNRAGAVLDVFFDGIEPDTVIAKWRHVYVADTKQRWRITLQERQFRS